MVKTEYYATREDGVVLVRTYSTDGKFIIQNETGIQYEDAIDPAEMGRTYTESDELIPVMDEPQMMEVLNG